jgi:energy-coupling factor transporter ATP-binding protein EcfA2
LRDVCGQLPAGGFCAILGPSGAGKSTLVDVLAGKRKAGKVEGRVGFTRAGQERVKIGYVDQVSRLYAIHLSYSVLTCSLMSYRPPLLFSRHSTSLRSYVCPKTSLRGSSKIEPSPSSPNSASLMSPILALDQSRGEEYQEVRCVEFLSVLSWSLLLMSWS